MEIPFTEELVDMMVNELALTEDTLYGGVSTDDLAFATERIRRVMSTLQSAMETANKEEKMEEEFKIRMAKRGIAVRDAVQAMLSEEGSIVDLHNFPNDLSESLVTIKRQLDSFLRNGPTIPGIDPELDRLLAEEEEIERLTREQHR